MLLRPAPSPLLCLSLSALTFCGCACETARDSTPGEPAFPAALRAQLLDDRQEESSWDQELLAQDKEALELMRERGTFGPFHYGAFPVPDYDRIGENSFRGVGSLFLPGIGAAVGKVGDKTIVGIGFYASPNAWNAEQVGTADAWHFCQVLVQTDFIDEEGFTHFTSQIVSRNHPDVIGQARFRTGGPTVDVCAFSTPEGPGFAIVNLRLFDLSQGTTILIAPRPDGSLRSLQIDTPPPATEGEQWLDWTQEVLKREDATRFFNPGS